MTSFALRSSNFTPAFFRCFCEKNSNDLNNAEYTRRRWIGSIYVKKKCKTHLCESHSRQEDFSFKFCCRLTAYNTFPACVTCHGQLRMRTTRKQEHLYSSLYSLRWLTNKPVTRQLFLFFRTDSVSLQDSYVFDDSVKSQGKDQFQREPFIVRFKGHHTCKRTCSLRELSLTSATDKRASIMHSYERDPRVKYTRTRE